MDHRARRLAGREDARGAFVTARRPMPLSVRVAIAGTMVAVLCYARGPKGVIIALAEEI